MSKDVMTALRILEDKKQAFRLHIYGPAIWKAFGKKKLFYI